MRKIIFVLLLFALIVQNNFIFGLKFIDFGLIFYFLYYLSSNKIIDNDNKLILLISFFSIILISLIFSYDSGNIFKSVVFSYKLVFIFLCFILFSSFVKEDLIFFNKIFIFYLIIMIIYIFIINNNFTLDLLFGIASHQEGFLVFKNGNIGINSASHLVGYVVAMTSIYFFFSTQNTYLRYSVLLLSIYATLLTGSRNPILIYGLFFVCLFFLQNIKVKLFSTLLIVFIFIFNEFSSYNFLQIDIFSSRSFSILTTKEGIFNDMSFLSRYRKVLVVLNEYNIKISENIMYFFIPITHANSEIFWADNLLAALLLVVGPFFTIMFLFYLLLYILKLKRNKNYSLLIYLLCALVGNFITEFIFVSIGALITIGQYLLIKRFLNLNNIEIKVNYKKIS